MRPVSATGMCDVTIRHARPIDCSPIAKLMMQLGYDVPALTIRRRLETLSSTRQVFVALIEGSLVGWIAVSMQDAFVTGRDGLIEGLVVDEGFRGRRIGRQLLETAGAWARNRGCVAVRVHSNVVREAAHHFYEQNGYDRVKTQHNFLKALG
jgi:GNAT superfamily N-acetyltransferase